MPFTHGHQHCRDRARHRHRLGIRLRDELNVSRPPPRRGPKNPQAGALAKGTRARPEAEGMLAHELACEEFL